MGTPWSRDGRDGRQAMAAEPDAGATKTAPRTRMTGPKRAGQTPLRDVSNLMVEERPTGGWKRTPREEGDAAVLQAPKARRRALVLPLKRLVDEDPAILERVQQFLPLAERAVVYECVGKAFMDKSAQLHTPSKATSRPATPARAPRNTEPAVTLREVDEIMSLLECAETEPAVLDSPVATPVPKRKADVPESAPPAKRHTGGFPLLDSSQISIETASTATTVDDCGVRDCGDFQDIFEDSEEPRPDQEATSTPTPAACPDDDALADNEGPHRSVQTQDDAPDTGCRSKPQSQYRPVCKQVAPALERSLSRTYSTPMTAPRRETGREQRITAEPTILEEDGLLDESPQAQPCLARTASFEARLAYSEERERSLDGSPVLLSRNSDCLDVMVPSPVPPRWAAQPDSRVRIQLGDKGPPSPARSLFLGDVDELHEQVRGVYEAGSDAGLSEFHALGRQVEMESLRRLAAACPYEESLWWVATKRIELNPYTQRLALGCRDRLVPQEKFARKFTVDQLGLACSVLQERILDAVQSEGVVSLECQLCKRQAPRDCGCGCCAHCCYLDPCRKHLAGASPKNLARASPVRRSPQRRSPQRRCKVDKHDG